MKGKMKKNCLFLLMLLITACSKPRADEIMTDVIFTVVLPDDVESIKINGELKCVNINTKEEVTQSSIQTSIFEQSMLKGLYTVHFNGTVICRQSGSSEEKSKRMRGYIENAVFLKPSESCKINVKLYEP